MNQKLIIGAVVVLIFAALGWFFYSSDQYKTKEPAATTQTPEATPSADTSGQNESEQTEEPSDSDSAGNTITFTDSGFNPANLTVKTGESVTWVNNSSKTIQVGSDIHPTHTANQELTGNQFVVELAPSESQSVQLNKTGSWGYHDHLNPALTGTIVVE